jgi:hypothetical protein
MSCRLDTRYCILMFDVFDKLVHGQVIFGLLFSLCHALSRFVMSGQFWPVFSRLSLLLMFHLKWSIFLTVGHALSRVATILYCVLSAKSYFVALLRFHALSRVVTRCHALSCFAMNGPFLPFFSCLSLFLIFHVKWSHFLTVSHALRSLCGLGYVRLGCVRLG